MCRTARGDCCRRCPTSRKSSRAARGAAAPDRECPGSIATRCRRPAAAAGRCRSHAAAPSTRASSAPSDPACPGGRQSCSCLLMLIPNRSIQECPVGWQQERVLGFPGSRFPGSTGFYGFYGFKRVSVLEYNSRMLMTLFAAALLAQDPTFHVGTAAAARGQGARGGIGVPAGAGAALLIPVAVVNGARRGPVLAIVS